MKTNIKLLISLIGINLLLLLNIQAQSNFQLNGDAIQTGPSCYRLTSETKFIYGSIWNKQKIDLTEDFIINTRMNFGTINADGADGIVFAFQGVCTNAGSNGEGIGIGNISPSLFVEIDTYQNGGNPHFDPAYDHISIFKNGTNNHGDADNLSTTVQASTTTANIEDGQPHDVRFTWIAATQTLSVFFDGQFRTSYTGDAVNTIFGGSPYVYYGFTAATGGSVNNQSVCIIEDPDITICKGSSTPLSVVGAGTFTWSPSSSLNKSTGTSVIATPATTTTYTVTGTGDACGPVSFTIKVIVIPPPDVTATNQSVCDNAKTAIMNFTSAASTTTFTWANDNPSIGLTASGTGKIPVFTAKNTTTSPVIATITVSPKNGDCPGPPKTFTYTVNPIPDVTLPADQFLCNTFTTNASNFGSAVTGTSFDWKNSKTSIGLGAAGTGNINAFVATNTSSADVTAAVTVTPAYAGCIGLPKIFSYTVYPTPTLVLPADQIICNTVATKAVSLSGPVIGSTFDWVNNESSIGLGTSGTGNIAAYTATNTTTTPVVATVTITPKTTTCTGADKKFTYTVNPTPDVIIPADQIICNTTATPFASFSSAVSGTTFAWTNTKTSIGLGASGTGNIPAFTATNNSGTAVISTVTVKPTASNCDGPPKTFTITVNPTPYVNAPADTTICETQTAINLKGSAKNYDAVVWTGGSDTFAPASDTTSAYKFTAADKLAGNVKLQLKADKAQCASVTDFITISFEKTLSLTATDKEICETETSIILTSTTNSSKSTWTTIDGQGTITPDGGTGITYTINPHDTTLTDINFAIKTNDQVKCPASNATLKLQLTDRPYIEAINSTICENAPSLALILKAKNITDITWTSVNGSGAFTKKDILNGQYTPVAADTVQPVFIITETINNPVCSAEKDTFKITVIGKPVLAITDHLVCTNFKTLPVALISKHVSGISWTSIAGNGAVSNTSPYVYTKGNTDSTLTEVQVVGTTINDATCQSVRDTLNITFISMPKLALSDKKCIEPNLILDPAAQFTHPQNATAMISWTKGKTDLGLNTPTITAPGAGTYIVTYQYTGCSVSDSIDVLDLPDIITKNYNICQSSADTIGVNLIKNAMYKWSDGLQGNELNQRPVLLNNIQSIYSVTVTDSANCSKTASFNVDYTPRPVISVTGQNFCKGTTGTASVLVNNLPPSGIPVTYSWSFNGAALNKNTNAITIADAGKYVTEVKFGDCATEGDVSILQYDLPIPGMKPSHVFCTDDPAGLQIKAVDGYTYEWQTGNHETTQILSASPTENTWYKVILSTQYNCKAADSAFVKVSCPPRVFAANVITPEKNDENKFLKVFGDHYQSLELMVYNRWGEVIFKSSEERPDWDGTYAGEMMPIGTYPYTIHYIGKYEEYPGPYTIEGKVTIIR